IVARGFTQQVSGVLLYQFSELHKRGAQAGASETAEDFARIQGDRSRKRKSPKRVKLLSRNLWRYVKLGYRSPDPPQRFIRYSLSRLYQLGLGRQSVMIFWKRRTQRRGLKCCCDCAINAANKLVSTKG